MEEGRISIGGIPIHYRIGGTGPPILLLHPSPSSSRSQLPLAQLLTDHFTVICPDTPGYGESPIFPHKLYDMEAYVERLHRFVKAMRIDRLAIYGSATGGQLAIKFGIMFPEKVEHLFLDNCGHFPEDLRTNIIDNYFPDLSPQKNGAHLQKIWEIATHLFKYFPWCCKTPEYKLNIPPLPVAVYHNVAMEYLVAGENYYRAYRAAFEHEDVHNILALKVPATILRWQGSIVKKYTDIIFESKLPENIGEQSIPASAEDRYPAMKALIIDKYKSNKKYKGPADTELLDEYLLERGARYKAFRTKAPMLQKDGSHLMEAWNKVKYQFPESNANILQGKLVDWYAYSNKN